MSGLQVTMIVLCFTTATLGWVLLIRQVGKQVMLLRAGRPDHSRTGRPLARTRTLVREVLGHTRMAKRPAIALAHWFTMMSFIVLFLTLVNAFLQLFRADAALPLIGHFWPYEWLTELFAWGGFFGIITLITVRQRTRPRRSAGAHARRSRFFGSAMWEAYYVELTILGVVIAVLMLRGLEYQLGLKTGAQYANALHFPLTWWLGFPWANASVAVIEQAIYLTAGIKILISFAWMITIGLRPTMGVAWHRFFAFFNIWFKRHPDGQPALGAAAPIMVNNTALTAATLDDFEGRDEELMGVGRIEDFTWKGLLDLATCTECGRCQDQCPAWNTDKPLSPKLLITTLRDHAAAKATYLHSSDEERAALRAHERHLADLPLIGRLDYRADYPLTAYDPLGPQAAIDSDVLWSCTTCGACVEQCPVDIEHVDAILDLRRHQVLIESAFPAEFGALFKNLETKNNPWGLAPTARLEWTKDLGFTVPVVGHDIVDLTEVDYLFWVGCAGALEERGKKTTRAVAELLHLADVSFAVLGPAESCTGDPARRAGNEILFQMLAQANIEKLNAAKATTIVVTCAHCLNTLSKEYPQAGGTYEVLHHTQLLNRLVRDKRLIPMAAPSAADVASPTDSAAATTVTYHDPCYLGRHNGVYSPPRELIGALPGIELREMPRHGDKSFCCGAGGARMWAEERIGTAINANRAAEAIATGADQVAIGCPFCRVMLTDGINALADAADGSTGASPARVEVVDIAQMLLAAVRGDQQAPQQLTSIAAQSISSATVLSNCAPVPPQPAQTPELMEPLEPAESPEPSEPLGPAQASDQSKPHVKHDAKPESRPPGSHGDEQVEIASPAPVDPLGVASAVADLPSSATSSAPAPEARTPRLELPQGQMTASAALAAMSQPSPDQEATPAGHSAPADRGSHPDANTEHAHADERSQRAPTSQPPQSTPGLPPLPSGRMSASEALALMRDEPSAAPAPQQPAAHHTGTPEPALAQEPPTASDSPAPSHPGSAGAPAEVLSALPAAQVSAPSHDAWQQILDAAQGQPIAASTVIRLLTSGR